LGNLGGLGRNLLGQSSQLLTGLDDLLAGCLKPPANLRQLLGAVRHLVRMSGKVGERRCPALLGVLDFASCAGQLLSLRLDLLGKLGLLLQIG
jgi:hypothetical protein